MSFYPRPSKAPNMSLPTQQYSPQQQQQTANQLRLYFAQLDSNTSNLIAAASSLNVLSWINGHC